MERKCSACGSNELMRIEPNRVYSVWGDASGSWNDNIEFYICEKCGHIEMYAPRIAEKNLQINELLKQKQQLATLSENLELEKNKLRENVNNTIESWKKRLEDKSITVAEHEQLVEKLKNSWALPEYEKKYSELSIQANEIWRKISNLDGEIRKLNDEMNIRQY